MDVIAFPARFLVVDLHVERQRERTGGKYRIEVIGKGAKNMFASIPAGCHVPPLAKAQDHVEKAVLRIAVRDGVIFAADGANANAAERNVLDRRLSNRFDDLADIQTGFEVGGVLIVKCGMSGSLHSSGA